MIYNSTHTKQIHRQLYDAMVCLKHKSNTFYLPIKENINLGP